MSVSVDVTCISSSLDLCKKEMRQDGNLQSRNVKFFPRTKEDASSGGRVSNRKTEIERYCFIVRKTRIVMWDVLNHSWVGTSDNEIQSVTFIVSGETNMLCKSKRSKNGIRKRCRICAVGVDVHMTGDSSLQLWRFRMVMKWKIQATHEILGKMWPYSRKVGGIILCWWEWFVCSQASLEMRHSNDVGC